MAHYQQLKFIEEVSQEYPDFFQNKSVLEVGSWDTNGSIRRFFSNCEYIGVDIAEGPGVDVVCKGQNLQYKSAAFDVVVSCECFEHNPFWKETLTNMLRMLKPGGICLITCATLGRKEHGTKRTNPTASLTALKIDEADVDYYHNLHKKDFESVNKFKDFFSCYRFFTNIYSRDLYLIAFKKSLDSNFKISDAFVKKIKSIKREKKTNIASHITKESKFWFTYVYALIIGEKKYHNNRYLKEKSRKSS